MPSNLTSYPKSYFPAGNRTIAWQLDYASDDPSFMVVSSHYQGPQDNSGWNDNFGQLGSWHNFSRPPAFQANGGGSIACASSGGQGHTTANLIHVTQGTVVPQYTKDNGASWHTCVGLPAANYLNGAGVSPPRTRALAADRGDIGTFYAYVKATGKVYKSIDGGANFSLVGSRPLDSGVAAIYILTVPGKAGHIFLGGNSGNTSNFLYRSQDHGATWTQVGSISRIVLIALGKEKDPGGYPTLFVFGSVRGVSGYYRSTDEGTNWTPFGRWPADFPQTCQLDFAQCMAGDWNIYGRVYVGMGGSGFAYFSL
jgi:hypothetical protein